jgi:peptidoglycan hydrolase-like protein with peptidoglycan-binding domain
VGEFVGEVEQRIGCKPIIYTGRFWKDRLGARSSFGCPLWIAEYLQRPHPPPAWPGWTFWQRTPSARAGGVVGRVDADLYPGTLEQLQRLCVSAHAGEIADESQAPHPGMIAPYQGFPLREGVAAPEVRTWQRGMRERAWTIAVDGSYGPESAGVCERFQRLHGLNVDGIVGAMTWQATFAER